MQAETIEDATVILKKGGVVGSGKRRIELTVIIYKANKSRVAIMISMPITSQIL
jgi:hypothetical protein